MRLQTATEQLIEFYTRFDATAIARLDDIYTHDVVFQDPAQRLSGLPALKTYFAALMLDVSQCRFVIRRSEIGPTLATVEWTLYLSHPRLNRGHVISVEGVSLLTGTDKIRFHRDYFDLGDMLYQHVPLLGSAVRHLKRRLRA